MANAASAPSAGVNPSSWLMKFTRALAKAPVDDGEKSSSRQPSLNQQEADVSSDASPTMTTYTTTREDLGRATWTFLHTFAAQYPDEPTRRQEKDARELIGLMTRAYPCAECAAHFEEIVRANPPDCSSGLALQQWMCAAHNEVNASLGKPRFNCDDVGKRWSALDCGDGPGDSGCSLEGRRKKVMSMRPR